jgi:putative FmdB family regulatory protein
MPQREETVPTYQYACTDCADRVEVVQKFTDDPLTVCASCGGRLRKIYSPVGIVFKGSGFYRTDSRKSPEPALASANGSNGKKPEGASGADTSSASSGSSGSGSGDKAAAGEKKAGDKAGSSSSASSSSGSKVA